MIFFTKIIMLESIMFNLTYNGQGRLAFYNIGQQGCVELFIPLAQKGID